MALTVSATDTEVQKPVNVIYNQMLLRNARVLAPYYVGTTPGQISENAGTATIKWRRYNTSADNASGIAPTTTALAELTGTATYMQGRDASTVHFSDVTATVSKYGQFYILNEEVDVFLPNGTTAGIVRTLAISAGRSLNQLQRNIAEDNLTIVRVGGAGTDGAITSALTIGSVDSVIDTLAGNSGMPFTAQSTGSTNVGSNPLLPAFWGITHNNVAYDISKMTGFKGVETYAGNVDTVPGEFGAISSAGYAVRFISTPDSSIEADIGGANAALRGTTNPAVNVDLYNTVIYGQDCIGSVGLGQSHGDGIYRSGDNRASVELIAKGRGTGRPSSTDDPFDEITTLAWKAYHTGAVTNANFGRVIRSGATDITT